MHGLAVRAVYYSRFAVCLFEQTFKGCGVQSVAPAVSMARRKRVVKRSAEIHVYNLFAAANAENVSVRL